MGSDIMKLKGICLIAAAVLSIGTASMAKDKGTLTKFPNWGVITVQAIYTCRRDSAHG